MKKKREKMEVLVEEYEMLKSECETMKEILATQSMELDETRDELNTTKGELAEMVKTISETRLKLHASIKLQMQAEQVADDCMTEMRNFLMYWLTKQNQATVRRMLKFYKPRENVEMMSALLTYLIFGRKKSLGLEVERAHFKIICEKISEDCVTLKPHTLMIKLMKRYGMNETLKEIALEGREEVKSEE